MKLVMRRLTSLHAHKGAPVVKGCAVEQASHEGAEEQRDVAMFGSDGTQENWARETPLHCDDALRVGGAMKMEDATMRK